MRDLCVVLILVGTLSCNVAQKPVAMDYFAGEFSYLADAATVVDCASGLTYAVLPQDAYLKAEQTYTAMNGQGERILMKFRGHLDTTTHPEREGNLPYIVIDSLLGFDRTSLCNPQFSLVGLYESTTHTPRQVLQLRADRRFVLRAFPADGPEKVSVGAWGQASQLELVLHPDSASTPPQQFELIPDRESLVANSPTTKQPLVFKKGYIH